MLFDAIQFNSRTLKALSTSPTADDDKADDPTAPTNIVPVITVYRRQEDQVIVCVFALYGLCRGCCTN